MGTCKVALYSVNVFELIAGGFGFNETTVERLTQLRKASRPILVTLLGMVILLKLEQSRNAEPPIFVRLLGKDILVRFVQESNARVPMLVTLFGIVISVKPLQLKNAYSPMLVTPLGIVLVLHPKINVFSEVMIMALQLFRLS